MNLSKVKKASAIALTAVMAVSLAPTMGMVTNGKIGQIEAQASEYVENGTCGENVTWKLDREGVLTISGTGEMECPEHTSLFYERTDISKVVIKDGITRICELAFEGCSNLKSVEIPNGVTEIGYDAFRECSSLVSIEIPDSVKVIGPGVFKHCDSLVSVKMPGSATDLGDSAFSGCSSLKSIRIPSGLTEIEEYTFIGCSSIKNIEIPDSVSKIRGGSFWGCSSLENVDIPATVKMIESYSFFDCTNLKEVVIPGSESIVCSYAFGFYTHPDINEYIRMNDFTMFGKKDSYAEKFAKKHGFTFKVLGQVENEAEKCAAHTWDAGVITKKPTTNSTGIKTYTCKVCKETKTATIPKLKANTLAVKTTDNSLVFAAKTRTFTIGVGEAQGKITYTLNTTAKKAKISVSAAGKVTVPKKCKKGTYRITVKAAGNRNYKAGSKVVTIKVN